MLCATFHTDIFTPRSLVQNQCVMARPQGGQPMPCIQPLTNSRQNIAMMATGIEIDPHGSTPMKIMMSAEAINPSGMKTRALLRSETVPMTNLLIP